MRDGWTRFDRAVWAVPFVFYFAILTFYYGWFLLPYEFSWFEAAIAAAQIGAAYFAWRALTVNLEDRRLRDAPRVRLAQGPVHFGQGVTSKRGHIRNVGYGPALDVKVDFGQVKVYLGIRDEDSEESAEHRSVKPPPTELGEMFENDREPAVVFGAQFMRRPVRAVFQLTDPDFSTQDRSRDKRIEGIQVTIEGVLWVSFLDRSEKERKVAVLPYRLVGTMELGLSRPPTADGKYRRHSGIFKGKLMRR